MIIKSVTDFLETYAPPDLQEDYDNCGLLIGNGLKNCTGILTTLDVTEAVVMDALDRNCNLIIAHHPLIFKGVKKLTGSNHVERTVISAIQNKIAVYAIHTNLDNVITGVNKKISDKLGLQDTRILMSKENQLAKLVTFCPISHASKVRDALFTYAGKIGDYSECSFNIEGTGTFKAQQGAQPFVGEIGKRHEEYEIRIEVIFAKYFLKQIIESLKKVHPYEEVAYDIYPLLNKTPESGSGMIGHLPGKISENELLEILKKEFQTGSIRHSPLRNKPIRSVAVCGGSGSFLINAAKANAADAFITSDVKYHDFFEADGEILLADIGHFESEQYTVDLLTDILKEKFPNFAVLKTKVNTNPVNYFV